jgi:hypothetical protein
MFNKQLKKACELLLEDVKKLQAENKKLEQRIRWLEQQFPTTYTVIEKPTKVKVEYYVKADTRGLIKYCGPFATKACAEKVNKDTQNIYQWLCFGELNAF